LKVLSYNGIKVYLLFSLVSSLLLSVGLKLFLDHHFFGHAFFLSLLIFGNFIFYTGSISNILSLKDQWSWVFLMQTLCFGGMSVELGSLVPLYLGFIPTCTLILMGESQWEKRKGIGLIILTLSFSVTVNLFFGVDPNKTLYSLEFPLLVALFFWGIGACYFTSFRRQNKFSDNTFHNNKEVTSEGSEDYLFFHDIINQTHGIGLFLEHKSLVKEAIKPDETISILHELKTLQGLIKNHFKLGHKNLDVGPEVVPFQKCKSGIDHLLNTFLSDSTIKKEVSYLGLLNDHDFESKNFVHYPSFIRIMTNLIKNVAEKKSKHLILVFDYQEDGLYLTLKNTVYDLEQDVHHLASKLERIILDHETSHRGLGGKGIESISYLCQEQKGYFNFYISDSFWVNEIFLPTPAANSSEEKKTPQVAA